MHRPLRSKKELFGGWLSDNKEIITYEINADSIYHVEHSESHNYRLKKDSIFIYYHDFILSAKVYFVGDTLIMESAEGKRKFIKAETNVD